jgi:hypothetical protein
MISYRRWKWRKPRRRRRTKKRPMTLNSLRKRQNIMRRDRILHLRTFTINSIDIHVLLVIMNHFFILDFLPVLNIHLEETLIFLVLGILMAALHQRGPIMTIKSVSI